MDAEGSLPRALAEAALRLDCERLDQWGRVLAERLGTGHRLLTAGNGGSAAQARHLAAELVGRFGQERRALSAIALGEDSVGLTAIGNDYGFSETFARQVRAHGRPGDVLLLLSTSGSSSNILQAAAAGRDCGMLVWALTGPAPNALAGACDGAVCVETSVASTVQECHLLAIHVLCQQMEAALAADAANPAVVRRNGHLLVVVGDTLLDQDANGTAERLSPHAPVPVVRNMAVTSRPGGAGLAAMLAAGQAGWRVALVTALGRDSRGAQVREALSAASVDVVDLGTGGGTPVKTRVRAAGQTLVRMDEDAVPALGEVLPGRAGALLEAARAVVVCDYGRGVAGHGPLRAALEAAAARVPLVWDPHPSGPPPVAGTAVAVPNAREAALLAGSMQRSGEIDLGAAADHARALRARWLVRQVVVTCGPGGAVMVQDLESAPLAAPASAVPGGEVSGAGDQFAVALAVQLGAGATVSQALAHAVDSARGYVARGGGPAPLPGQDGERIGAVALAERVRAGGGTVVAAGGCFDLLHAGHVSLLQQARALGDCLVVCVNSDRSVARLKGPDRPVVGQDARVALLSALACVDAVAVFEEDTPHRLLQQLRPHVWVKGGDYAGRTLPESAVLEGWGGRVVLVPYLDGRSTSAVIAQLRGASA